MAFGHISYSSDLEENSLLQRMQTYFVLFSAGTRLSQPDARRSSVAEERVLIKERSSFLAALKVRVFTTLCETGEVPGTSLGFVVLCSVGISGFLPTWRRTPCCSGCRHILSGSVPVEC